MLSLLLDGSVSSQIFIYDPYHIPKINSPKEIIGLKDMNILRLRTLMEKIYKLKLDAYKFIFFISFRFC